MTGLERGIRLSEAVNQGSSFSDEAIWNNRFYTFLYYLRYHPHHTGISATPSSTVSSSASASKSSNPPTTSPTAGSSDCLFKASTYIIYIPSDP